VRGGEERFFGDATAAGVVCDRPALSPALAALGEELGCVIVRMRAAGRQIRRRSRFAAQQFPAETDPPPRCAPPAEAAEPAADAAALGLPTAFGAPPRKSDEKRRRKQKAKHRVDEVGSSGGGGASLGASLHQEYTVFRLALGGKVIHRAPPRIFP
jgi:CelD/BcsL family acetyltransferase involved in cellulose biosynthesis